MVKFELLTFTMAKKGERPILIPEEVKVDYSAPLLQVEGKNGKASLKIPEVLSLERKDGKLFLHRRMEGRKARSLQGLFWSLVFNLIFGVNQGFEKRLEIIGVGFGAEVKGKEILLSLGFSHQVKVPVPEGLNVQATKNQIMISGIDKEKVGNFAAQIRRIRPPEPYKGKGVRYLGEYIRHKRGKAVVTTET